MVGMEQLEVHSKSYLVRWIHVSAGNTISWSIQPHKKSLNFGVFKHPGGSVGLPTPHLSSVPTFDPSQSGSNDLTSKPKSRNDNTSVIQKLESVGMKSVAWMGKCEADKVTMGKYDVMEGEGGMYGLVFDNTFSKQVSKTVTFVLMTYPTNAPPKSGHHLHYSQASSASASSVKGSPSLAADEFGTSPPAENAITKTATGILDDPRPKSSYGVESKTSGGSTFYTGILHKRRRKHNTYARRFFSLDFTSSTLSYYQNRHSSALRGSIPLSLAAVGTNEKSREISIDSGAEIWHLKAGNAKDFIGWRDALDRASQVASSVMTQLETTGSDKSFVAVAPVADPVGEQEWGRAQTLVGRISGIRDAVRRLAQDTDPKYNPSSSGLGINNLSGLGTPSPSESGSFEFFKEDDKSGERISFWKRKASSNNASPAGLFRRSVSAQLAVPMPGGFPANTPPIPRSRSHPYGNAIAEEGVHDNCMAILGDLDQVVSDFSTLLSESKQRRLPLQSPLARHDSRASLSDDEFFDANDGGANRKSQIFAIRRDSEDGGEDRDSFSDGASESSSEFEGVSSVLRKPREGQESLFPTKPKSLIPLPLDSVPRRSTVPPSKVPPPSLINFLRKNVGKDFSTIAMPVSANEPTSLLQRVAEQMEYTELLDAAAQTDSDAMLRLLNITAFAISSFSSSRVKERAIRKPFNPMLGETFELVREDKGYRFIAEKISHRPVQMAAQAEAQNWTFLQAPTPVQKFWGKSAELNTEGRARVFLHSTNEMYSWTLATSFLRNLIAGEKYVEPVSTMTVLNESTGAKAVATFKAGGMFAGRSEEVSVQAFDGQGSLSPTGLGGKWTSHLNFTNQGADTGKTLWQVGALVEDPPKRYGFTAFAAGLNEVTQIEKDHIPPTDSRLRPDQRALEDCDIDRAEALKARLEERQRSRRRVMEEHGEEWTPKWFFKAGAEGDEDIWRLKGGKENYWEARGKGDWSGVIDVLEA